MGPHDASQEAPALPRFSLPSEHAEHAEHDERGEWVSGTGSADDTSQHAAGDVHAGDAWDHDDDANETIDPLDVAKTTQRHTLDPVRARLVLRRTQVPVVAGPALEADATSEVQVEDILLEAYAEEPPPAPRTAIAAAIASSVSPPPGVAAPIGHGADSRAVDELLRRSDPMFVPQPAPFHHAPSDREAAGLQMMLRTPGPVAFPAPGFAAHEHEAFEAHSLAPFAFASGPSVPYGAPGASSPSSPSSPWTPMTFASGAGASGSGHLPPPSHGPHAVVPRRGGVATAALAALFAFSAVGLGVGVTVAVRTGTFAAWKASAEATARGFASRAQPPAPAAPAANAATAQKPEALPASSAPVAAAPFGPVAGASSAPVAAPFAAPAPAPVASAAAGSVPTLAVDALPRSAVPATSTLVTFPASSQGHRVFFDGRPLSVEGTAPVLLRCGRHMIRIGSHGTPRVTDLTCGAEQSLAR